MFDFHRIASLDTSTNESFFLPSRKFFRLYGTGPQAFELSKSDFVSPCQRSLVLPCPSFDERHWPGEMSGNVQSCRIL